MPCSANSERVPADFCGNYIDSDHSQTLTSMWKANRHAHAINIVLETESLAFLAFRSCSYSWDELLALKDRLAGDHALAAWLATIPARWVAVGPDTIENRVSMDISSAVPDAAERVRQHIINTLAVPASMILVRSDGTGQVLRPWGTVRIVVVRPNGDAIGPNDMGFLWEPVESAER